ncbi:MAG: translation factor Sua5 [Deinococcus sp.]|nr:translation factor Sua5 [Deinococcus sp.]
MHGAPSNSQFELKRQLGWAVQALRAGQIVGYPSETVWGLAAHLARPGAVEALTLLKGREAGKPIQLSCLNLEAVRRVAHWSPALDALATFWPGPLTVVAPARPDCPADLAPGGWVGVRVPDHPVIQGMLAGCGGLLATTSLNPSGQPAARTFAEAQAYALADLLVPSAEFEDHGAGTHPAGLASTVIQLPPASGQPARILRPGILSRAVLEDALAQVNIQLTQGSTPV